ncbi:hypothetical protein AVEN_55604-1 [Araneus ventricosus]|uniref:DDE-1 domain-containing protein n=1 Tax=Araneus ventricosus TaxID=182803 RepID=A0A4Y2PAC7_ARAVE|nr:hypothetical protein AVEN_55604-1 [Araneus ventricosus]
MLVIGKSKSPRCFKGIKSLEVKYEFNKKSRMTSEIFDRWLKALNKQVGQQRRKIALLIDNYPIHSKDCGEKLKNFKTDDIDSDDEDVILADLKEKWKTVERNGRITDDATLSDILEVDAELLTASHPADEEILNSLMDNNKGPESDSDSENEDMMQSKPHRTEMLQSFETNKRGFQMEENVPDSLVSSFLKCKKFYENLTSRNAKQCKITEFFK